MFFKETRKSLSEIDKKVHTQINLFQPFLKISLGRELWNIVDVIFGILLLISILKEPKRTPDNSYFLNQHG